MHKAFIYSRFLVLMPVNDRSGFPFTVCSHRAGTRMGSLHDAGRGGKAIRIELARKLVQSSARKRTIWGGSSSVLSSRSNVSKAIES